MNRAILAYPSAIAPSFVGRFADITVKSMGFDIGRDSEKAGSEFLEHLQNVLSD